MLINEIPVCYRAQGSQKCITELYFICRTAKHGGEPFKPAGNRPYKTAKHLITLAEGNELPEGGRGFDRDIRLFNRWLDY